MRRPVVVVLTVLVLAGTAAAERPQKKPGLAFAASYGGTFGSLIVGGVVFFAAGGEPGGAALGSGIIAIGPSAGHFYAGESRRGWISAAVRGAGLLVLSVGVTQAFQQAGHSGEGGGDPHLALGAMAAGGLVYVGSTLYDWVDAPRAARRTNARALGVVPAAIPARDGTAPGLVLVGSF